MWPLAFSICSVDGVGVKKALRAMVRPVRDVAIAIDVGLCERCNPLGLRDSASSQVHGTVFVAVALGIVALALAARFAVAGIGPFSAAVAGMTDNGNGLVA